MKRLIFLCLAGSWVTLSGCGARPAVSRLADDHTVPAPGLLEKRVGSVAVADPAGHVYAIGGDTGSAAPTMEVLDTETGVWRQLAAPPAKRFYAGAAFLNGRIYVVGGENDAPNSDAYGGTVLIYDVAGNAWTTGGALALPRSGVAAAAVGGKIYTVGGTGVVFGGSGGGPAPAHTPDPGDNNFIDAFGVRVSEAYDIATGTSQLINPVPRRRANAGLVAGGDGKLYAIGGWFEGDFYGFPDFSTSVGVTYINAMVEAYDPATNLWQSVARMRTPRSHLAAVLGHDGKIYTFGGVTADHAASNAVEVFDPATATWSARAPMPTARSGVAAAVGRDGRFYVLGGSAGGVSATPVVEIYDPAANTWRTSHVAQPGDELSFDKLAQLWDATDGAAPSQADTVGWRVGRCFNFDDKTTPKGGLLVGYEVGDALKVLALETDGAEPDYFDAITADKRSTVLSTIDGQDAHLQTARVVDGRYLGSLYSYVNDAGDARTFEYQVRKTRDWYLTRVVAVTAWSTLPPGTTKALCYHKPAVTH